MISRVLSVGLVVLFAAFAAAPRSESPSPCTEIASASSDHVTELAMGVARAFGGEAKASGVQRQQAQSLACALPSADEVVIVTAG